MNIPFIPFKETFEVNGLEMNLTLKLKLQHFWCKSNPKLELWFGDGHNLEQLQIEVWLEMLFEI